MTLRLKMSELDSLVLKCKIELNDSSENTFCRIGIDNFGKLSVNHNVFELGRDNLFICIVYRNSSMTVFEHTKHVCEKYILMLNEMSGFPFGKDLTVQIDYTDRFIEKGKIEKELRIMYTNEKIRSCNEFPDSFDMGELWRSPMIERTRKDIVRICDRYGVDEQYLYGLR